MKTLAFSSTDFHQLQRQLHSWRQRQQGRSRLPAALWDAATQIARAHGVSRVARTLRIDFYALERRVRDSSPRTPLAPVPAPFIELKLDPQHPLNSPAGSVELIDGPHRHMRIHTGHDPAAWIALAESFWRPNR